MPERFDLSYTGADNAEHRPVMIHRALLGSMERFAGILIEHHGGRLPLWLAPVQALVLPVADRHNEAANEVAAELVSAGVRAAVDERSESVGKKIRDAELAKAPYMLVLGDKEQESGVGRRPLPRRRGPRRDEAGRVGRAHLCRLRRLGRQHLSGPILPAILAAMPGTHTTTRLRAPRARLTDALFPGLFLHLTRCRLPS